jgi:thiamine-phosphate pyrophosphorylase
VSTKRQAEELDVQALSIPHSATRCSSGNGCPGIPHPQDWGLYLVTDRHQTGGRDLEAVVEEALAGGVRAVQLREKDLPVDALYRLAERLLRLTRSAGAALLINDRGDVALGMGADGVHLTRRSLPPGEVRRLLGPDRLIGMSCHSVADVAEAAGAGVDFVVLGPIYATPSKAAYGPPLSPAVLRAAREAHRLPIIAIGGIKAADVSEVIRSGADGVAVISAVMAAADPAAGAPALLRAWSEARENAAAAGSDRALDRRT